MKEPLYRKLSASIIARKNCQRDVENPADAPKVMDGNQDVTQAHRQEWLEKHTNRILQLVYSYMPHGSGFNSGTQIDLEASHQDKLVFYTAFYHMNGNGRYDSWTKHTVTVMPSLFNSFHLRINGRNRSNIKDYIYEAFSNALTQEVE